MVRAFYRTYGFPGIVTRCSNNYGPYQFPEKLIPFSIQRALSNERVLLYGDGMNVRDWIHVEDHVDALLAVLFSGEVGETYNIGASDEINNLELARRLLSFLGKDPGMIAFVEDRLGHDRRYAIDSTKIKKTLGWRPKHSLERDLREVLLWYVNNPEWIDEVTKKQEADRESTHSKPKTT